jgi:hypothetical protein
MGNEVGNTHRGDLAYCPLCKRWTWRDVDQKTGKEILFKTVTSKGRAIIWNLEITFK